MLPLRELIGLLGLPRVSMARLAIAFGLLLVAIALMIASFVWLVGALHLYLLWHVSAPAADFLIGLGLLLLAGAVCLIARRLTRRPPAPKRSTAEAGDASALALAWLQRHPGQSAVLAAVLGFCMGASPEARKAMDELAKPRR